MRVLTLNENYVEWKNIFKIKVYKNKYFGTSYLFWSKYQHFIQWNIYSVLFEYLNDDFIFFSFSFWYRINGSATLFIYSYSSLPSHEMWNLLSLKTRLLHFVLKNCKVSFHSKCIYFLKLFSNISTYDTMLKFKKLLDFSWKMNEETTLEIPHW